MVLREAVAFRHNGIDATIQPGNLPQVSGGGLRQRSDLVVLRMIADTWPDRPIHFSRTTADYAYRLGFGEYLLSHGLTRKLVLSPSTLAPGHALIAGSGWFDLERSLRLWKETFRGPRAIVRLGQWVDRPSLSVPYAYLSAGLELAEALRSSGRLAEAASVLDTVRAVAASVGLKAALEPILQEVTPGQDMTPGGDR